MITVSDLKFKKAKTNNDLAGNGGLMSKDDVGTSLFPDVTGAERTAGLTRFRKEYLKNEQANGSGEKDLTFKNARLWLASLSPAEDYFRMKAGTDTDVQSDAGGYSGWSGVGSLDVDVEAGAMSLVAECEAADGFQAGLVHITDGINSEFLNIGSVTWDGNKPTLNISGSFGLINSYERAHYSGTADIFSANTIGKTGAGFTADEHKDRFIRIKSGTGAGQIRHIASNTTDTFTVSYGWTVMPDATSVFEVIKTYASMVVQFGDIAASYSDWAEITAAGTYDETTYPPVLYPVGTITEDWTLTFTSSTAFEVYGSVTGFVGTGTISGDFQPANGGSYYFKLRSDGWGGTWAQGDTVAFKTVHSAKSVWLKQVAAAGVSPHNLNRCLIAGQGDTT